MKSLNKLINEKLILKKRKSKSISSYEDIIDILFKNGILDRDYRIHHFSRMIFKEAIVHVINKDYIKTIDFDEFNELLCDYDFDIQFKYISNKKDNFISIINTDDNANLVFAFDLSHKLFSIGCTQDVKNIIINYER
jgi:hypothetical protein